MVFLGQEKQEAGSRVAKREPYCKHLEVERVDAGVRKNNERVVSVNEHGVGCSGRAGRANAADARVVCYERHEEGEEKHGKSELEGSWGEEFFHVHGKIWQGRYKKERGFVWLGAAGSSISR